MAVRPLIGLALLLQVGACQDREGRVNAQWLGEELIVVDSCGVSVSASRVDWDTNPYSVTSDDEVFTGVVSRLAEVQANENFPLFFFDGKEFKYNDVVKVRISIAEATDAFMTEIKNDPKAYQVVPSGVHRGSFNIMTLTAQPVTMEKLTIEVYMRFIPLKDVGDKITVQFELVGNGNRYQTDPQEISVKAEWCDSQKGTKPTADSCSGHGTCVHPYGCTCFADTTNGYWSTKEGADPWEPCAVCATNYGGDSCVDPCPTFFGKVCAGHGTCMANDLQGWPAFCSCKNDEDYGFWDKDDCSDCKKGYYGFKCDKKCNASCGACYDENTESAREGTGCLCPEGFDPATNCTECAASFFGTNCSSRCTPGSATTVVADKKCECAAGYGGEKCLDRCYPPDCNNNGVCKGTWPSPPSCVCNDGYVTPNCTKPCLQDPPEPQAYYTCSDGEYVCVAGRVNEPGTTGCASCEKGTYYSDGPACLKCSCENNLPCNDVGVCLCDHDPYQHWKGTHCEKCDEKYLEGNGTCDVYNNMLRVTGGGNLTTKDEGKKVPAQVAARDASAGTTLSVIDSKRFLYFGGLHVGWSGHDHIVVLDLTVDKPEPGKCNLQLCRNGDKARLVHMWVKQQNGGEYLYTLYNRCFDQVNMLIKTLVSSTTCQYTPTNIKFDKGSASTILAATVVPGGDGDTLYALRANTATSVSLVRFTLSAKCDTPDPSTADCLRSDVIYGTVATWIGHAEMSNTRFLFLVGTNMNRDPVVKVYDANNFDVNKADEKQISDKHEMIDRVVLHTNASTNSVFLFIALSAKEGKDGGGVYMPYLRRVHITHNATGVHINVGDQIAVNSTAEASAGQGRGGQTTALSYDTFTRDVLLAIVTPLGSHGLRYRDGEEGLELRGRGKLDDTVLDMRPYHDTRLLYTLNQGNGEVAKLGVYLMYYITELVPHGFSEEEGDMSQAKKVGIVGEGFAHDATRLDIKDIVNMAKRATHASSLEDNYILIEHTGSTGGSRCKGVPVEVCMGRTASFTADGIQIASLNLPKVDKVTPSYVQEFTRKKIIVTGEFVKSKYLTCRFKTHPDTNKTSYSTALKDEHARWAGGPEDLRTLPKDAFQSAIFINSTAIECLAPNAKVEDVYETLAVSVDGQTYSKEHAFKIVGMVEGLAVSLEGLLEDDRAEGLFTNESSVIEVPRIVVKTIDSNGYPVGADMDDHFEVKLEISFEEREQPDEEPRVKEVFPDCVQDACNEGTDRSLLEVLRNVVATTVKGVAFFNATQLNCQPEGTVVIRATVTKGSCKKGACPVAELRVDVVPGKIQKLRFARATEDLLSCEYPLVSANANRKATVTLVMVDASGNILRLPHLKREIKDVTQQRQFRVTYEVQRFDEEFIASGPADSISRGISVESTNEIHIEGIAIGEAKMGWNVTFSWEQHPEVLLFVPIKIDATCLPDYYFKEREGCLKCPENAQCLATPLIHDGKEVYLLPQPGYYASDPTSTLMQKCLTKEACPAAAAMTCKEGSTGNLCAECIDGYAKSSSSETCKECSTDALVMLRSVAMLVGGFVAFAAYSLVTLKQGAASQKGIVFRMLFSHLQVLSVFRVLDVPWEISSAYNTWNGLLEFSFGTNLNPGAVPLLACNLSTYSAYLVTMMLPSVFIPVSLFVWCVAAITRLKERANKKSDGDWTVEEKQKIEEREVLRRRNKLENKISDYSLGEILIVVGVVVFFILYQMLALRSSAMVSCTVVHTASNSTEYMTENMGIECSGGEFSTISGTATSFLLLYGILVPALLCFSVLRYRRTHSEQSTQMVFSFLLGGFKGNVVLKFWQCVIMLRKLCVVLALAFPFGTGAVPVYTLIWILTLFLLLQLKWRPYVSDQHNRLEAVGLVSLLLTLNFGLLFYFETTEGFVKDAWFYDMLLIMIIVVNIAMLLFFGFSISLAVKNDARALLGVKEGESLGKAMVAKAAKEMKVMSTTPEEIEGEMDPEATAAAAAAAAKPAKKKKPLSKEERKQEAKRERLEMEAKLETLELKENAAQREGDTVAVQVLNDVPATTQLYLHRDKPSEDDPYRVVYKRRSAAVVNPGSSEESIQLQDANGGFTTFRLSDIVCCEERTIAKFPHISSDAGLSHSEDEEDSDPTFILDCTAKDGGVERCTFSTDLQEDAEKWVSYITRRVFELAAAPNLLPSDDEEEGAAGSEGSLGEGGSGSGISFTGSPSGSRTTGFSSPRPDKTQHDPLLDMLPQETRNVLLS